MMATEAAVDKAADATASESQPVSLTLRLFSRPCRWSSPLTRLCWRFLRAPLIGSAGEKLLGTIDDLVMEV